MSIYVGVNNVARKVSKIYVGVNGVARQVTKAYIGVNDKARLCFNDSKSLKKYTGTISDLSVARDLLTAISNSNYAIFGPGETQKGSAYTYQSDAYNRSLTKRTLSLYNYSEHASAALGTSYVLFGGGYSSGGVSTQLSCVNNSLSVTSKSLTWARYRHSASGGSSNVVFAGGLYGGSTSFAETSEVIDSSLTSQRLASLSYPRRSHLGSHIGSYHVVIGGYGKKYNDPYPTYAEYYTDDLTHSGFRCSYYGASGACTANNSYILFVGGYSSGNHSIVYSLDSSLTFTSRPSLPVGTYSLAGTIIDNYRVYAGGHYNNEALSSVVAYDQSFTQSIPESLSTARQQFAAASIGNYGLFGGGDDSHGTMYSSVEAYYYG